MNILEQIIATKRREITSAQAVKSMARIEAEASVLTRQAVSFRKALLASPTGIIAEFKRKSPSKGFIKQEADTAGITASYERAGAAAVSVLTDRDYFAGCLDDLIPARKNLSIPILRKDFIIDPYQICEARIAGADVVLLIAAALTPANVRSLAGYARALGLEVLLEIHNEQELGHLCDEVDVAGINNRDLSSFRTDPARSFELGGRIPERFVKISESGLSDPRIVRQLRSAGFQGSARLHRKARNRATGGPGITAVNHRILPRQEKVYGLNTPPPTSPEVLETMGSVHRNRHRNTNNTIPNR